MAVANPETGVRFSQNERLITSYKQNTTLYDCKEFFEEFRKN